jgi:hypothetical protein
MNSPTPPATPTTRNHSHTELKLVTVLHVSLRDSSVGDTSKRTTFKGKIFVLSRPIQAALIPTPHGDRLALCMQHGRMDLSPIENFRGAPGSDPTADGATHQPATATSDTPNRVGLKGAARSTAPGRRKHRRPNAVRPRSAASPGVSSERGLSPGSYHHTDAITHFFRGAQRGAD